MAGIDGNQIGRYFFTAVELKGKRSIHFKYVNGEIVWLGGFMPSSR